MKNRLIKGLAISAVALLGLTACGGGSDSDPAESEAASGELTPVTVGVLSIAPSVAVEYGIQEGIFEKHGLDVQLETGTAGAAMLPAVSTGQMTFAVGNPLSVITAADRGLDMRIVSGFSNSRAEGDDINGVVVKADSGIDSWADLEGKTTSVNALQTQGDLTILAAAEEDGADPSKLLFSEMPFPDMEAQLDRGNMDAMWTPEPFLSQTLANPENKLLGYNNQDANPGMPTMVTFTSGDYAEDNAETTEAFKAAMEEVLEAAETNNQDARALLPDFLKMDPELAANMNMEIWDGEIPVEQLNKLAEQALHFEFIDNEPDMESIIMN